MGTFCQSIAQSLLVYQLTGSTFLVGVVNFAQFAAVPVLAPVAGAAADRFDRRRLLIITQVAAFGVAALLTVLAAIGAAPAWVVITLAGAIGVTSSIAFPINRTLVPALISDRNLGRAINLDSVSVNLARALGPISGAFIVANFGVSVGVRDQRAVLPGPGRPAGRRPAPTPGAPARPAAPLPRRGEAGPPPPAAHAAAVHRGRLRHRRRPAGDAGPASWPSTTAAATPWPG